MTLQWRSPGVPEHGKGADLSMESTAAILTAAANGRIMVAMPVASAGTALPRRFPRHTAVGSVPMGVRSCLGEELAVFADHARA